MAFAIHTVEWIDAQLKVIMEKLLITICVEYASYKPKDSANVRIARKAVNKISVCFIN